MGTIKAYKLKHSANPGKIDKVRAVVKHYRKLAAKISSAQWILFEKQGLFSKNHDIKHIPTVLSARYKQTCQYQVVGILDSFVSNRQNDFIGIVRESRLDEETKHKLFIINKYCLWQSTMPFSHWKSKLDITASTLKLARKIFRHVLSRHRRPSLKHINMALDNKVALVSGKTPGMATQHDYWVRFSTLDKGHPVYLPLNGNEYYDSIQGARKNFIQINITDKNEVSFCFTKDVPARTDYVPEMPKLALDLGFVTLFASDRGDLWGRTFFSVLKKYDILITRLSQNRQRQGFRIRSSRYDALVANIREYMKNEINRSLNRAIAVHKPAEIIVERLDFRSPELSRRMNRLISLFGKSLINSKLASLNSSLGIKITETNPAYSSQECSVCGYVDRKNRITQSKFKCRCCNTALHADVNGARNHLARSSGEVDVYKSNESVLHVLTDRFLSDMEHSIRHYRMAPGLLSSNPYFAGPSAQPKELVMARNILL
jgi:putative transposase